MSPEIVLDFGYFYAVALIVSTIAVRAVRLRKSRQESARQADGRAVAGK